MNFDLDEGQRLFQENVAKVGTNELADGCVERANNPRFPWDIAKRFGELGLLGITLPEADGGAGGTVVDAIIAVQAIAASCPRSADVIQAGNFGAIRTFAEYASGEQKERYLPDLLSGRSVMSVGMTEPDAGSAVTELVTSAKQDGDDYLINGTKIFGTHSAEASVFLVYVRFGAGTDGIGSVLVDRETPGLEFGKKSSFMNGEEWAQIYFDDCRIPKHNVLLGPGGFKRQIAGFNIERLGNAARSLAVGKHAFDKARDYAMERKQFGALLCEFQGLQWQFAETATMLEAAHLMLMKAAVSAIGGLPSASETAMAKLICNQAGHAAANHALQVFGGHGFNNESIVQYCYRRTRGWMIAGGTTEILKNRIAEGVFGRRFPQRPFSPSAGG